MASRTKYKQMYARWHRGYERRSFRELMRTFRKWGSDIDLTSTDPAMFLNALDKSTNVNDLVSSYITIYTQVGKKHASRVGKDLNAKTKVFDEELFNALFEKEVAKYLQGSGFSRIEMIRHSFIEYIVELLNGRLKDMMAFGNDPTPFELTEWIHKTVNSPHFYRWQAWRIARTESTAASNFGAIKSAEQFGYAMEKEWMSAHDSRTRRKPDDEYDHRQMDGKRVDKDSPFEFMSMEGVKDKIMFPGDPKGHAGNVINCRCSVSLHPKRNKQGDLIRI